MIALSCGIKNIAGRFFGLVTKHACDRRTDRQTDRITTPKTALSIARAVKIVIDADGGVGFIWHIVFSLAYSLNGILFQGFCPWVGP